MKEPRKYYQLIQNEDDDSADLYIFGDISTWPSDYFGDKSAWSIVKELKELTASHLNVHINSYGGAVSEGLAIYNVLKNHKAKVTTYCDGFACSAASVVFMAGDERIMSPASLLMIHNAWTIAMGNAEELRKAAEDIETITQASVNAYKSVATISEEEIKDLMNNETWILPDDAVSYGFATSVSNEEEEEDAQQSAFRTIMEKLTGKNQGVLHEEGERTISVEVDQEQLMAMADRISGNLLEKLLEPEGNPEGKKHEDTYGWNRFFEKRSGRNEN